MKGCSTSLKCITKPKWDITLHLLDWLLSESMGVPQTIKEVEEFPKINSDQKAHYSWTGHTILNLHYILGNLDTWGTTTFKAEPKDFTEKKKTQKKPHTHTTG